MNIGDKIGKLTILEISSKIKSGRSKIYLKCKCDCENIIEIRKDSITNSKLASCGCEKTNNKIKTLLSQEDRLHNGINIIGNTYGELTVVELINPLGIIKYKCLCSCGKKIIVRYDHLINNETKSCGCKTRQFLREANLLEYGKSAFNDLYRQYTNSAKQRGISFNLTKEYFKELTTQNCSYCGIEPSQIKVVSGNNGTYTYNGVDRVNSELGYSLENCVACCSKCNYMKRDYNIEDFKTHIIRLYQNLIINK